MKNGILRKLNSLPGAVAGANPFRGTEVAGQFDRFPQVGQPFVFMSTSLAEPENPLAGRVIMTSTVKSVMYADQKYTIRTLNSTYELEEVKPVKVTYFPKPTQSEGKA